MLSTIELELEMGNKNIGKKMMKKTIKTCTKFMLIFYKPKELTAYSTSLRTHIHFKKQ